MDIQSFNYVNIDELQRYFELLIKTLNNGLSDNGWTVPQQSTTNITTLINRNARPILPRGTIWFDTTLGKLKVLVTQAVPGVSDGVTETITSV